MESRSVDRRVAVQQLAATACLLLSGAAARGAGYPDRAVRIVVPAAPGTSPDLVGRVVAEHLQRGFAKPVVVENKPGAIGTIGLATVARAAPDGHLLGVCSTTFLMAPSLLAAAMPFDLERELKLVALVARSHPVLVVPAGSAARTATQLMQQAKERPGSLTYASGGNGTPSHIGAALLVRAAGVEAVHVPFQGAATVPAVVAGEVGMYLGPLATMAALIDAGRLRALASAGPRRLAAYPQLPTLLELGYAGVELTDWQGVIAPAATPPEVTGLIAAEIAAGLRLQALRQQLESLGLLPAEPQPDEAPEVFFRREFQSWNRRVRELGIKPG